MNEEAANLNDRLVAVEDRLAIYNVLAAHPVGSDSVDATILEAIYSEDTIFDRGPSLSGVVGSNNLLQLVHSAAHQKAVEGGLVHFGNLPLVELRGDHAIATSYVMLVTSDEEGAARDLSNHGRSQGHWIHRIVANRWTLQKVKGRWSIKERRMLFHDGSPEARELIGKARTYFEG